MAKDFETDDQRDRSQLNEEASPQRQQDGSGASGTGMEEYLQQKAPETQRETGGDDNGGDGSGDSGGSNGDSTPPDVSGGDDAPSGGSDGSGETESATEENTSEGGLNFNYGPLSVSVAADYSAITSAKLNFMGNQDIQSSLKIEKAAKGYTITLASEKPLTAGLGAFQADSVVFKKLKVTYDSGKNAVKINQLDIVAAGLRVGEYLKLNELKGSFNDKKNRFSAEMGKASGTIMGYTYQTGKGSAEMASNGDLIQAAWTGLKAGKSFLAQSIEFAGTTGLKVRGADLEMPQILGKTVRANFDAIDIPKTGGLSAEGQISVAEPFTFLDNTLQVESLQSKVKIAEGDQWFVELMGGVNYSKGNTQITGNVSGSYDSTSQQAKLNLENGNFLTQLSGMSLAAKGIAYQSEGDFLQIMEGTLNIPKLGSGFAVAGSNMRYSASEGFDFDQISLSASEGLQVLPNLRVAVQEARLEKNGTDYSFKLANAMADLALASFKGHTQISLSYDQATGLTGNIQQFEADSPFFSVNFSNAPFENGVFSIEQAALKLNNLGPISGTESQASGVKLDANGLAIGSANLDLPSIGGVKVQADVQNFSAGAGGISVGSAKVKAAGDLNLAGGALKVQGLDGDANFNGQSWDVNALGKISTTTQGLEAQGDVKVNYVDGQPSFDLAGGTVDGKFGNIEVKIAELTAAAGQGENRLEIGKADVKVADLAGLNIQTTVSKAGLDSSGFNAESIMLKADGNLEPVKGFKVSKIEGSFSKQGNDYQVTGQASAKLSSKNINGKVDGLKISYGTQEKAMSFARMDFTTPVTQGYVTASEVTEEGIKMDKAAMFVGGLGVSKGKGYSDKLKMTAQGLEYNKEGLKLASSSMVLPPIGGRQISATVNNLNIGAEGGVTGSGSVNLGGDISLAGGAVKLANASPYFNVTEEGWDIGAKTNLQFNTPGATGSGDVNIRYDKEQGLQVDVSNGQAAATFLDGQLKLAATGINFQNMNPETGDGKLVLESGTLDLPKIAGGLTGTIQNMEITGQSFDFEKATVAASGLKVKLFDGMEMALSSLEVSKKAGVVSASLKGGLTLNRQKPKVQGTVNAALNYDSKKGFSGSVSAFNINTSLFKAKAEGINIRSSKDGKVAMEMAKATVAMGDGVNEENLAQYFPAIKSMPWILDVVKGVEFVAEGMRYDSRNGLQITNFYPNVPPVEFEMMGMKGMLDIKNQKGELSGSKGWSLKDFGMAPKLEADIPIVAGVSGSLSLEADANINIGAGLQMARQPDGNWRLAGGLDLSGQGSVSFGIGVKIGSRWLAEASAKLKATLAVPFTGGAKVGTAVRFNPETKSVEVVDSLDFAAYFLAELRTKLDLELEAAVLGGLWSGKTTYNIGEWLLGSLSFLGTSSGNSVTEMFGNFKAGLGVYSSDGSSLWSKGSPDQAAANRLGVPKQVPPQETYDA